MERAIPYKGNDPYIFISYAHRDAESVHPIITTMQNSGFRIWFDEGIDPGTEWDNVIASQIEKCSYFLAFVSKNYLASENCKDELNFARDLGKQRLLVYLEDVSLPSGMAMRMNRIQSVFKHKYHDDASFYKVLYSADGIYAMCDGAPKEEPIHTTFFEQAQSESAPPPIHTPKIKGDISIFAVLKQLFIHCGSFFRKSTTGQSFTRLFVLCAYATLFCLGLNMIDTSATLAIVSFALGIVAMITTQTSKKKHPEIYARIAEEKAHRSGAFRTMAYIMLTLAFLTLAHTPEAFSFFLFWTGYCFLASFIPKGYARICLGPIKISRILIRVIAIVFSFLAVGMTV